jgi:hypothetical protein
MASAGICGFAIIVYCIGNYCKKCYRSLRRVQQTPPELPLHKPVVIQPVKPPPLKKLTTPIDCAICTESAKVVKELNCKHQYHELCINTWLSVSKTCPFCRAEQI